MKIEYKVPKTLAGISVRAFLVQKGFSVHLWRRLKNSGTTCVNGNVVIAALTKLEADDILTCEIPESTSIPPIKGPLEILYEDDALLFVNKPAGQLVHPLAHSSEETLLNYAAYHLHTDTQDLIPHPVHRLDRNTTGIVMIAKLPHVQHVLSENGAPRFHRRYLAILEGTPNPANGTINAPIGRKPSSIIERCVADTGKPAVTDYKTIAAWDDYSLVEAAPVTGRTHQIRVHFSHIGCPLAGDDLYGGSRELIQRQALHAYIMELTHPVTRQPLRITAPVPPDFEKLLPADILQQIKTCSLIRK